MEGARVERDARARIFGASMSTMLGAINALRGLESRELDEMLARLKPGLQRTVIALSNLLRSGDAAGGKAAVHYNIGYAQYLLGDLPAADKSVAASIESWPEGKPLGTMYYLLALIRLHHDDGSRGQSALAALRSTIEVQPTFTAAWVELMDCLSEGGDMAACRALAEQAGRVAAVSAS